MTDMKFTTAEAWVSASICKNCGETLSGDGSTIPYHCINVSEEDWWYSAPDEGPFYCDFEENEYEPSEIDEWHSFDPDC